MIGFALGAIGLLVVTLALILWPFLKRHQTTEVDREHLNVQILRDQLAEIEEQLNDAREGASTDEISGFEAARNEVARRLLAAAETEDRKRVSNHPQLSPTLLVIPLGIVLASALGYAFLGRPAALVAGATDVPPPSAPTIPPVQDMVAQLEARLNASPADLDGWDMLARSYGVMGRTDEALSAYRRGLTHFPDSPVLLVGQAETLAKDAGNNLAGEPARILERVLEINPTHRKGLWLAGIAALTEGQRTVALDRWQTLSRNHDLTDEERQLLTRFRAMAGAPTTPLPDSTAEGRIINVSVSIEQELIAQLGERTTLFVFARASNGPRIPLAVARVDAPSFPLEVALTDAMAMMPERNLSSTDSVILVARLSKTGNAIPKPGDLQGETSAIAIADGDAITAKVHIDSIVAP
ncbi:MAG: c-type cytochrome biogenesis protein CcmI [Pseudomonadota bacterium]